MIVKKNNKTSIQEKIYLPANFDIPFHKHRAHP